MTKANFIVVLKICLLEKPRYIAAYKTIVVNILKNRELNISNDYTIKVIPRITAATKIKNTTTALLRGRLDKFIKILFLLYCPYLICFRL